MDAGWGRLDLRVDAKGTATWTLTAKGIGNKTLTIPENYRALAGTTADIAILPTLNKNHFRQPNSIGITDLRSVLDEWDGVHVRLGGIRVYPYAEGRDDWLYIDRDRAIRKGKSDYSPVTALASKLRGTDPTRALLNLLSARSYVGEVNVSSPTDEFELKASREGFVGEKSLDLLREVVRAGIDWSTVYREYYIRREGKEEAKTARLLFEETLEDAVQPRRVIDEAVDYIKKEVKQVSTVLPADERRQFVTNISKAVTAVIATNRVRDEELKHLQLIASTSSLLLVFAHEVKSLLGNLDDYESRLTTIARQLTGKSKAIAQEMAISFRSSKSRFLDLLGLTSVLSVDSREAKPVMLAIAPRAKRASGCFDLIKKQYEIDVDVTGIPATLRIGPMLEAEIYSLLLNALSNAI
jgi:hypothetical protein